MTGEQMDYAGQKEFYSESWRLLLRTTDVDQTSTRNKHLYSVDKECDNYMIWWLWKKKINPDDLNLHVSLNTVTLN